MDYFRGHDKRPDIVRILGVGTLACAWAMGPASPARADDAQPAPGAQSAAGSAASTGGIEDVVVTATKRKEPLQQVPNAVSVVDGEQAAQQNLNNINQVSAIVPSLNFRDGASNKDQALFIRGMGTVTTSPGAEPSVATVVDGVPLARPGQVTFGLLDVQRIEVLRGPQGTLFGKNASAGVVNIVTQDPTDQLHGYGDLSYYSNNQALLKTGISGPLVPGKANGLLDVLVGDSPGNVTNVYNGETVNGATNYGARSKVELTPSDNVRVTLSIDYLHTYNTEPTGIIESTNITYPNGRITPNPVFAKLIAPVVAGSNNLNINANTNTYAIDDNGGLSAQVDWKIGDNTLTSITAFRRWANQQQQDYDRTSSPLTKQIQDNGELNFYQVSEELRLASPKGGFVEYITGLYYLHTVDQEIYQRHDLATTGAVNTGIANYGMTNDNYSAFGDVTLNFTNSFRGIAGVRLIGDELDYHHDRISTAADTGIQPSSPLTTGSTSDLGYADRLGLQYDLTKSAMTYVTYSRGYKGPAYNVFFNMLPSTQGAPLKPETSDSYEIGVKSKSFDDRLLVNLAGFYTVFSNYQANFPNLVNGGVVTNLVNAGTVSSRGIEADLAVKPVKGLTVTANLAFTDAHVDNTPIVPVNWAINGKRLPFAPTWKTYVRADYLFPVNDRFAIDVGTNYRWQSAVQYDLSESPDTIQKPYGIWDADVTLNDLDHGWKAEFLIKNILNQHYATYLQSSGTTAKPGTAGYVYAWVGEDYGRYVGGRLRKEF